MMRPRPTDPREVMVKIVKHYEELADQFKAKSLTQKKWFDVHYKPSAILHDRAKTKLYKGPGEIMKFWQDLKASGVTSISFKFDKDALPKVFQVDMNVKYLPVRKKPHDYVEIAVIPAQLELLHREHESADPGFDILFGHWDVCEWRPEGEITG
jgi:hypothetical protein